MTKKILEIKDLNVSLNEKRILKNFQLTINENEIHILMGPNGSGKSTLSKVLAGHSAYKIESGEIFYKNKNLLNYLPEIRSHEGIFLGFQHPIEIPGLSNFDFLRIAYNEKQKYLKKNEIDPLNFLGIIKSWMAKLEISEEFLYRDLNTGFSGGEKKKNEVLQLLLLQPNLVILDELDSGLDMDALKTICQNIKNNLSSETSFLVITHYPKIIDYLEPNYVHIFLDGKIQKTGNFSLLQDLEKNGYQFFLPS